MYRKVIDYLARSYTEGSVREAGLRGTLAEWRDRNGIFHYPVWWEVPDYEMGVHFHYIFPRGRGPKCSPKHPTEREVRRGFYQLACWVGQTAQKEDFDFGGLPAVDVIDCAAMGKPLVHPDDLFDGNVSRHCYYPTVKSPGRRHMVVPNDGIMARVGLSPEELGAVLEKSDGKYGTWEAVNEAWNSDHSLRTPDRKRDFNQREVGLLLMQKAAEHLIIRG